jgi:enolase
MTETSIAAVIGRRVWDSRGRPTVEAEVRLKSGAAGRAIAPAGASTGSGEAVDLRDGGTVLGGLDVRKAVTHVNGGVALVLQGLDAFDQAGVDARLVELDGTPNFERIGGNAAIAVSMAVAHAAAAHRGVPLWQALRGDAGVGEVVLPLPEIQIFGGGAHAGHRVDVQDFMLVCPGAENFAQALDWTAAVYHAAGKVMAAAGRLAGVADEGGWWPVFDGNEEALDALMQAIELAGLDPGPQVAISLDIAATQFRRADGLYHLDCEGRTLDADGMCEMLLRWTERYPIVAIEDPLAEDDVAGLARFTAAAGDRIQVIGDDAAVTNAERVRTLNAAGACNTLLVKPNQAGTLTRTREALEAARAAGWGAIVSARSGESEDTTIVHLAVGWEVAQLKVGSFTRSERMAKWNEVLRIEEAAGPAAQLARPYRV